MEKTATLSAPSAEKSVFTAPGMPALLAIVALGFANFSLLLPATPTWALQGGASEAQAGAVTMLLMATTILTQARVNAILTKIGWGKSLALALIFLALPALLQAFSSTIWWVFLTSALRGVGFGLLTVCGSLAITYLVGEQLRGKAVGAYGLAIAIPQFLLASAAPALVDVLGARWVLAGSSLVVLGVLLTPQLGRRLDGLAQAQEAAVKNDGVRAGTFALIWPSLLALIVVTMSGGALLTFAGQIAATPWQATLALLLLTGLAAPARWYAGSLSDRLSPNLLTLVLGIFTVLGVAFLGYSVLSGTAWLIAGAALLGVAYGGLQSVTMVKAYADAGASRTGRASFFWNATFDLGTGIGALVLGVLAQGLGFSSALLVMAGIVLLSVTLTAAASRK